MSERLQYWRKQNKAVPFQDLYCPITIDDADQSAFWLPFLVTETKDMKSKGMKVKIIGPLKHSKPNKLYLF